MSDSPFPTLSRPTPPTRQRGRAVLWLLVAVVFALAGALTARQWLSGTMELQAASVFPEPRPIAPFELATAEGERFDESDLAGRWTLMFFGFTNCPDICPDTLSQLAEAVESLKRMRVERLPQVVFVSVDPGRDQGERLGEYVRWFNPEFRAVTGADDAQIQKLTRQLSVIYFREQPDPETGFYNVDHSGMVVIIDPEGRMFGRFAQPIDTQAMVADLFRLTS